MNDAELLDAYSAGDEHAFAALVRKHINMVYSAARRQIRDTQQADDVTQAVFIILTQKAAKLDRQIPLAAWLLKTTHFACLDANKRMIRRQRHEHAAALLAAHREKSIMEHPFHQAQHHEQIHAELDAAMARLNDRDRGALTLRYLNGMSINQTAGAMGITTAAAAKRIARAVDRLRSRLIGRGVIVPAAVLSVAMEHVPRFSAGSALAQTVAAAASLSTATGNGPAIAKGTMQIMNWIKLKLAAGVLLATTITAAAGTGAIALLQTAPPPPAPPPPQAAPANAPANAASEFAGTLANGVSIEVLGINESPSHGRHWWKPDGSPLTRPPYDKFDAQMNASPGDVVCEVAVRIDPTVTGNPHEANVRWHVLNSNGSLSSDMQNPSIDGLQAQAVSLSDDPAGFTVQATVAAGEWTTRCTGQSSGNFSESRAGLLGFGHKSFLFGPAIADHGKTRIVVAFSGVDGPNPDVQMVAVDRAGNEKAARTASSVSDGATTIAQFVSDLPPDSIKEWQLQTRPFDQWIEIRHIPLHRGQKTKLETVTSDAG